MFIVKIGVLSLVAVCLSYCSGRTNAAGEKLSCRSMQVEGGYGYVVVYGADTLIYQPYIPAIGEKTAFTSEEDALKIGTLVCRKLAEKQPPTVSRDCRKLTVYASSGGRSLTSWRIGEQS